MVKSAVEFAEVLLMHVVQTAMFLVMVVHLVKFLTFLTTSFVQI